MTRSGMGRILARRGLMVAVHGTPIILRWREVSGSVDPVTGARETVGAVNTETVNGFVHTVAPGAHTVRQYAEIETGDIIVDLPSTVSLARDAITFEVAGVVYVQKPLGDRTAAAMDVRVAGNGTFQTLVLRRQT